MTRPKPVLHLFDHFQPETVSLKNYKQLIYEIIATENIPVKSLNVVLVDDEYLKHLHARYLKDDSYTDVMTFNLAESGAIEGEIYISYPRAAQNAEHFRVSVEEEIARLVIHGLLHLNGLDDQTTSGREQMRQEENRLLAKFWVQD